LILLKLSTNSCDLPGLFTNKGAFMASEEKKKLRIVGRKWKGNLCVSVFALTVTGHSVKASADVVNNIGDWIAGKAEDCFSGGCDPVLALSNAFNGQVANISSSLVGPAKEAFDSSMETLFKEQINPTLIKVNSMATARIRQTKESAIEVLGKSLQGVHSAIEDAGKTARYTVKKSVAEIKQEIIQESYLKMNMLRADLRKDMDHLMDRIESVVEKVDCSVEGFASSIRNDLVFRLGANAFPNPLDQCRQQLKVGLKPGILLSDSELYLLTECHTFSSFSPETEVKMMLWKIAELQVMVTKLRCVARKSGLANEMYTEKYFELEAQHSQIKNWNL
jgi:hypothetical protein